MAEPTNALSEYAGLVWYGLGAAIAGYLAWRAKNYKPTQETASISAALMDNRVIDPLVGKLSTLELAIVRLCGVIEREHDNRLRVARDLEIRDDIKNEERMRTLLEKLEQKLTI